MKSIWNGAIGFGLVNIPVKMYSATESSTLDLDMLDKSDLYELKMAVALIDLNSETFDGEQYKDTYSADLLKIIKQKAKGQKLKVAKGGKPTDRTIDLMEKLKASLEKSKKNIS
ncbi:DNA end-binding protein Ku [Porphyromonadaceae bacterium KH3CP3RA]|nr:DNA end-binding protein Ku [Porphyromonadaceae bacterium KH3CP3RA]